jgi:uncharacterized membrane protein YdjX (TVP38/TMEM64 family)
MKRRAARKQLGQRQPSRCCDDDEGQEAPPTFDFPVTGAPRAARLLMLGLLGIGAALAWRWRASLDPLAISAAIARYPAAPLGFFALHIAASLLFIPRTVLAIAAGLLFGSRWGILWAEIGGVVGATAGFLVARYIHLGLLDLRRIARIGPILARVERGGWRAVVLMRLIPVMPHSLANYALGLTRIPLGSYALGSLIGQLPMTIAYVDLGAAGEQLVRGGAGWLEPTLIGLAMLAVTFLISAQFRWRLD